MISVDSTSGLSNYASATDTCAGATDSQQEKEEVAAAPKVKKFNAIKNFFNNLSGAPKSPDAVDAKK